MSLAERFAGLELSVAGVPVSDADKATALAAARVGLVAGATVAVRDGTSLQLALRFLAAIDAGAFPVMTKSAAAMPALGAGYGCLTSGSTGAPKVCQLSVDGAMANARAHAASLGITAAHTVLQALPMQHAFGVVAFIFTPLVTGCAIDFNDAMLTVRALQKRTLRNAVLHVSPAQARWMAKEKGTAELVAVSVGAGLLDPAGWTALMARFPGARSFATYGLTEAGPRVTTGEIFGGEPAGYVGSAIDGVTLSTREGRLVVKAPWIQGEIVTRDTVDLRDDGSVIFCARESDILKVGGLTHYVRDLENAVRALVDDCYLRVTHNPLGDDMYDVVAAGASEDAVWARLRETLEPSALPRQIKIVPALQRNAMGKIERAWIESVLEAS